MVTIPAGASSDCNNQILSPVLTPQMVQQIMTQQSLAYLKQQKQSNSQKKPPPLIQTTNPSKGFKIIDLTKAAQNPRSQNVVYLQKDMNGGSGIVLTTPSGLPVVPVSPMNIISNKGEIHYMYCTCTYIDMYMYKLTVHVPLKGCTVSLAYTLRVLVHSVLCLPIIYTLYMYSCM